MPAALVSEDQMLALVSLAGVASQTPTVGDVGTLARSHIRQMVPRASLALFIVDAAHDEIVARYTRAPRLGALLDSCSVSANA